MTGEITLRGQVRPVGGLKEKLLAAHRAGIRTVLVPLDNASDLQDVPPRILKDLCVQPVEHMDQVLMAALAVDNPEDLFPDPTSRQNHPGSQLSTQ